MVRGVAVPEHRRVWLWLLALLLGLRPGGWAASPQSGIAGDKNSATSKEKQPPPRREYVGDDVCRSCHQQEAASYLQTAHHLTSAWPSPRTIRGDFAPGSNILRTSNPYLHFEMTTSKDGYFQSAVEEPGPGKTISLKRSGVMVKSLPLGTYSVAVRDSSKKDNFHLIGPGVNKRTSVKGKASVTWRVTFKIGKGSYRSDAHKKLKRTFTVIAPPMVPPPPPPR